ncbi:hypothetical protein Mal52_11120 [Symmachiella dynata]|uniref:Uncharacterized protein n=1 Tax=Symmachiella dynata TaxID=2527995 RepID=A0A517ZJH8_9PLAN|nr:hypothetical protein [Symmachiella dynata]QDU42645.1 hypothetical protein Mal52_11120 [Symmachiella dynata]
MIRLQEEIIESRPGFHRASFPEVGGEYELTTSWPMAQAFGEFDGIDFYFRAKYGAWEFETENKQGHSFPNEHPNYFVSRGTYDEKKPNVFSNEWSLRILRKCFVEFWGPPRTV